MSNPVAETILQQLGGNQFLAMTGAKQLFGFDNGPDDRGLQMKLPRPSFRSCIVITLKANDTYTVEAYSGAGLKMTLRETSTGLQADQLRSCFKGLTGLEVTL